MLRARLGVSIPLLFTEHKINQLISVLRQEEAQTFPRRQSGSTSAQSRLRRVISRQVHMPSSDSSRNGAALAAIALSFDASRRVKCNHFRERAATLNCDNDATMDGNLDDWLQQRETVDVETRAIVSSLVTAVCISMRCHRRLWLT